MMKDSRVARLLKDARAAVMKPERPETPCDIVRGVQSKQGNRPVLKRLPSTESLIDPARLETLCQQVTVSSNTENDFDSALQQLGKEFIACSSQLVQGWERARMILCSLLNHERPLIRLRSASPLIRSLLIDESSRLLALETIYDLAKYDHTKLLREEQLLDPIVRLFGECSPQQVAIISAIFRYISCDEASQKTLITAGILPLLKKFLVASVPPDCDTKAVEHVACSIRNLSVEYGYHIVKLDMIPLLCPGLLIQFAGVKEIVSPTIRALAKFIGDHKCVEIIQSNRAAVQSLLECFSTFKGHRLIISRGAYVLATIVEGNDEIQRFIGSQGLPHIVDVVESLAKFSATDPETAISILRLLSNLTVNETAGRMLIRTLAFETILEAVKNKDIDESPQLVLHALMCLSNLTFYLAELEEDRLNCILDTLGPILVALLFHPNVEGAVEATRVLGNVSSIPQGRQWIIHQRCDEICQILLGHSDLRLVYNCCGVFVNLSSAKLVSDLTTIDILKAHAIRLLAEENDELNVVAAHLLANLSVVEI